MTAEQIAQIRRLLASDRLSVPGHEVMAVAVLLQALEREEMRLAAVGRVRSVPEPAQG